MHIPLLYDFSHWHPLLVYFCKHALCCFFRQRIEWNLFSVVINSKPHMLSIELKFFLTWHIPVKGVYFLFCVQIMAHLPVSFRRLKHVLGVWEKAITFFCFSPSLSFPSIPLFFFWHTDLKLDHMFRPLENGDQSAAAAFPPERQSQINEGPWNPSKSVWAEPFERLARDGVITTKWLKRWLWLLLITSRAGIWDRRKSKKSINT